MADAIIVPVLPSLYDQKATTEFLERLKELKRIRKNKRPLGLVRNRVRQAARASARLDQFLSRLDTRDVGRLHDRALYNEIAWQGLGVFDLRTRQAQDIQHAWEPVLTFAESPDE
jgi:chromosome partitioning protein